MTTTPFVPISPAGDRARLKPPLTRALRWRMALRRATLNRWARLGWTAPTLNPPEAALLDSVHRHGWAWAPATSLGWGLGPVHAEYARFAQWATGQEGWRVRGFPAGAQIAPDSATLQFGVSGRVRALAEAFYGRPTRLLYPDLWLIRPGGSEAERRGSQVWHRDPEEGGGPILKVFYYLDAVDAAAGALEYIPGSRRGGPWTDLPAGQIHRVPPEAIVRLDCPAQSIVCFDASALHRGGYALTRPRPSVTWAYVTPASLYPSTYDVVAA